MSPNIKAVETCADIPEYMTPEEISQALQADDNLNVLTEYMINGWPSTKAEVKEEIRLYWLIRDNMAAIDGIVMKSRSVVPN